LSCPPEKAISIPKNSLGDILVCLRMKYSGIRRPEVDCAEPNVNFLPLSAIGKSSLFASPRLLLATK
jgi:hypothetical protein